MTRDLRILLWDIDGTLVRSARAGAFKEYTIPVLRSVFGTAGRLAEMSVSGMTDLQIVAEALAGEGFTPEQIRGRVGELRDRYLAELERVTSDHGAGPHFELLPGAREALEAAEAHPRYRSALLTGNVEPAARLKMRLFGLEHFFRLPGAYGDDSHDRRDLPRLARERIARHTRLDLRPEQFVVIGDTPNDIACARHFGARVVGVGTGRMHGLASLAPHAPDALLPNLSDTGLLMRTLDAL
jgi:phosphoglycolate phosphatase-like HAD superfamily hydrolase